LCFRPYPKPDLPGGPSHKSSSNHYYGRDGRRESCPPIDLLNANKLISSGEEKQVTKSAVAPKPGKTYNWDL